MTPGAPKTNHRVLRLLEEAGISVVLLDRRPAETSSRRRHDLVGIDNRRASFSAAEHLLRLGSRRIGFLMYEGQASTARGRAAGYREAVGSGLVYELKPEGPLALPPEASQCDGFVCANDRIAGRLMHTLLAKKVRIPQDVRIVGIDDVNYCQRAASPADDDSSAMP
jgi:GntR family transcriptional regulator, arabinose operon transcriptional repressor